MPSPPSTRPSDARGRRSFAFVRERHAPIGARRTANRETRLHCRHRSLETSMNIEVYAHTQEHAVRLTVWLADFSPLKSATWRWWTRRAPDGTTLCFC